MFADMWLYRVFVVRRERQQGEAPAVYAFWRQGEMDIDRFSSVMDEEGYDVIVCEVTGTSWAGIDSNIMRDYYISDSDFFPNRVRVWIERVRTLEDIIKRIKTGWRGVDEERIDKKDEKDDEEENEKKKDEDEGREEEKQEKELTDRGNEEEGQEEKNNKKEGEGQTENLTCTTNKIKIVCLSARI